MKQTRARSTTMPPNHLTAISSPPFMVKCLFLFTDTMAADPWKLIVVVRTDLGMTAGKMAAQTGHAVANAVRAASAKALSAWGDNGEATIILQAVDEEHLRLLQLTAESHGIACFPIIDAGRTQVAPSTWTCLGLGPARASTLAAATRSLRLYP